MATIYTFNDKVLKNSSNDKWLIKKEIDPYNPLGLPTNTIRCRFQRGFAPNTGRNIIGDAQTLVDSTNNVWDIYKESNDWTRLFRTKLQLFEVLGANTTNVTNMNYLFDSCNNLTTITLFDTSNVTDMNYMFGNCQTLTSIPLFNTSKVTYMEYTFYNCYIVQSGALALYNQASSQTTPPSNHYYTFYNCGSNTQTGFAELQQIPTSWGGSGA